MTDDPLSPAHLLTLGRELAYHLHWLAQTPEGNRVVRFTIFLLLIVGAIGLFRTIIVRTFGSAAFGCGEIALGLILLCFAGYGWHVGHIGIVAGLCIGLGGWVLVGFGFENIKKNQRPIAVRKFKPQTLPPQNVYGEAKAATDWEIHEALREKLKVAKKRRYRFKE